MEFERKLRKANVFVKLAVYSVASVFVAVACMSSAFLGAWLKLGDVIFTYPLY